MGLARKQALMHYQIKNTMEKIQILNQSNIDKEHICCAFSDKKCVEGYERKKDWLKREFENGYVFRRIEARAKVFIEYGPAELGWVPVVAPNYLLVNCFWVSGKYKGQGYGKELMGHAFEDAKNQGKNGLVTIVGTTKFHFMSDTNWLIKYGFETCEKLPSGFSLLALKINANASGPVFGQSVKSGQCEDKNGLVVYYSNRCPFTEYYVSVPMYETARKRNIPLKVIKIDSLDKAQGAPSPATIFSLFYNGHFITTDLSVCLDSRFDKILNG
jgi:GNAT superfamily N-acetyltransferase